MKQLTLKTLLTGLLFMLIFSCQKGDFKALTASVDANNVFTVRYFGEDIKVMKKGNYYFWFDDVIFDQKTFDSLKALKEKSPAALPRSATSTSVTNYWTNGIVYYSISSAFDAYPSERQKIVNAINHWMSNTSLRFIQRTNQPNYIGFERVWNESYTGASQGIGMQSGYQYIKLDAADPFDLKTVIHEIGHAVGLYHEQSRADRNDFIQVYTENMSDPYQFQTYIERNQPGTDVGSFDWNSIMLYDSYSGSKNGGATMLRKPNLDPFYTFFNTTLSMGDLDGVASIYGAPFARFEEGQVYISENGFDYSVTTDIYIRFYSDASCTQPFVLPSSKKIDVKYTEYKSWQAGYTTTSYSSQTLAAGNSSYLVGQNTNVGYDDPQYPNWNWNHSITLELANGFRR